MSALLDRVVEFWKWPFALYMFVSLPSFFDSLDFFSFANYKFLAMFAGFGLFYFGRTVSDASVRTSMQVIAHELTHSFFALLTLHKVKHIRLNPDDTGGEMGFEGKGNWLIVIAPYFFPLFGLCYAIVMTFMPESLIFNGILGYFLGYHTDTVCSQIHPKQTDLPKVGYTFCWLFLPGANFWIIGSFLAFNSRGWEGIKVYFDLINRLNYQHLETVIKLIF